MGGTVSKKSDTRISLQKRSVTLAGFTGIMFDRYPGDNSTKLEWHQKVYLKEGTSQLVMPTENIVSFLSSHNTNSAAKRLRDARKYKAIANACLSFCVIRAPDGSSDIPFTRNGEPILMGKPGVTKDEKSGLYYNFKVARLEKGIPNPKERPVLPMPWELTFSLDIIPNREIKEQEIRNLFVEGGMAIGLGTYRGLYGKFEVVQWADRE